MSMSSIGIFLSDLRRSLSISLIKIFFLGDLYCKSDSCGTKPPFDVDNTDDCCQSREKNVTGKLPLKALCAD